MHQALTSERGVYNRWKPMRGDAVSSYLGVVSAHEGQACLLVVVQVDAGEDGRVDRRGDFVCSFLRG